jgi:hypothetical protein
MATQKILEVRSIPKVTTENSRIQVAEVTRERHHRRAPRNGMVHLTPNELVAVLKFPRSRATRDWVMILLVYRHGLRASEACDMKLTDADLKSGSLSIRRAEGVTVFDTVTGKVLHVTPPLSVILTLDDGTNQEFKIPEGQKFDVDGQMVDAWGLREGMKVLRQRSRETPETVVTQKTKVAGKMPPSPPLNVPILVVVLH